MSIHVRTKSSTQAFKKERYYNSATHTHTHCAVCVGLCWSISLSQIRLQVYFFALVSVSSATAPLLIGSFSMCVQRLRGREIIPWLLQFPTHLFYPAVCIQITVNPKYHSQTPDSSYKELAYQLHFSFATLLLQFKTDLKFYWAPLRHILN